jgi:hypothetical protein
MAGGRHTHPRPARHVPADVLVWRSDVLRRAGCETALARDIAADGDIDLHDLLKLIDRGCPPHLAARILTPLDRPSPAAPNALASDA